jgi:hypothetical protein
MYTQTSSTTPVTTTPQDTSVDPTALALSRAIRQQEGGDYTNMTGDNGTSAGAYQWNNGKLPLQKGDIPANFKSGATQFGLDPTDFSQTNQDHLAYLQIKHDLDSGLSQSQVAAKWNSGLTTGWQNHVGDVNINGKTVHYDTPAYVASVQKFYNQYATNPSSTQGGATGTNGTASGTTGGGNTDNTQTPQTGFLGSNPSDSLLGQLTDNAATRGLINLVPGAKTLGNYFGTAFGGDYQQIKDLIQGTNNYKNYDTRLPSPGDVAGATAGLVGTGLSLAAGGGALDSALAGSTLNPVLGGGLTSATESPMIQSALQSIAGNEPVSSLSAAEKLTGLSQFAQNAEPGVQPVFQKAMQELTQQVLQENGVAPEVASKALGILAKMGLWIGGGVTGAVTNAALGNPLGNFTKGLIPKTSGSSGSFSNSIMSQ